MSIKQKTDTALPEIIFTGTGDAASNRRVLRMAQAKKLRKLYQGVYTSNLESPAESIVTRLLVIGVASIQNRWTLASTLRVERRLVQSNCLGSR